MISRLELKLSQILWYQSFQVDGKLIRKHEGDHPMPTEAYAPPYFKEALEAGEKQKEQQKHADLGAAVLKSRDDLKKNLGLPRVSLEEAEVVAEDDSDEEYQDGPAEV